MTKNPKNWRRTKIVCEVSPPQGLLWISPYLTLSMGPCGLMAMYTLRGTAGQGGFNISVIKTAVGGAPLVSAGLIIPGV